MPTQMGRSWMRSQIQEAIDRGPHMSALDTLAMEQLTTEVVAKEKKGQCKVVIWDLIKHDPLPS